MFDHINALAVVLGFTVAMELDPYVYMNISLTDSPVTKDSGLGINVKVWNSFSYLFSASYHNHRILLSLKTGYLSTLITCIY